MLSKNFFYSDIFFSEKKHLTIQMALWQNPLAFFER